MDVEAAPGDFCRLYLAVPGRDGVVLHTNHFLAPRFGGKDVSVWVMPDSPVRLQRIRAGRRGPDGPPTLATFRALLPTTRTTRPACAATPTPGWTPARPGHDRRPRC